MRSRINVFHPSHIVTEGTEVVRPNKGGAGTPSESSAAGGRMILTYNALNLQAHCLILSQ